ncbi:hypothetical protein SAMN05421810_102436 [Amycolatopsis arida]|uniref:Secreted protein n=1 Tax=Amycolatopsis arida TaxID=587909 RepID=A0A1I5PXK2_9PSEU|nr:hypothetical protein [Amycolatopsis arida]TDX98643.1 hypothetical protein CLV69_101436 [Amycolatopsis arida]SFP38755.1 hypothetical protein SAMN05421810_102436 [Amycolatopsis arida]
MGTHRASPGRKLASASLLASVVLGMTVLSAPAAHAHRGTITIHRPGCGGVVEGHSNDTGTIWTHYRKQGSCKGHAWIRVKTNLGWSSWKHAPGTAVLLIDDRIYATQHKGCGSCRVGSIYHNH